MVLNPLTVWLVNVSLVMTVILLNVMIVLVVVSEIRDYKREKASESNLEARLRQSKEALEKNLDGLSAQQAELLKNICQLPVDHGKKH